MPTLSLPKDNQERIARGNTATQEPSGSGPKEDNWKHRSLGMRCATCMWFVEKARKTAPGVLGRCRRHAPSMHGWPVMFDTDWCGDHKIDEEKV